jgi:hypothetical protein
MHAREQTLDKTTNRHHKHYYALLYTKMQNSNAMLNQKRVPKENTEQNPQVHLVWQATLFITFDQVHLAG